MRCFDFLSSISRSARWLLSALTMVPLRMSSLIYSVRPVEHVPGLPRKAGIDSSMVMQPSTGQTSAAEIAAHAFVLIHPGMRQGVECSADSRRVGVQLWLSGVDR